MTTIRTANNYVLATPGKASNIALWMLQALVALAFVAAGSGKLLGSADMIALFEPLQLTAEGVLNPNLRHASATLRCA